MKNLTYISWLLLALSLALLASVVMQAGAIRADARERAALLADREQQLDRSAHAQRVSTILVETIEERTQLAAFAQLDILAAVQLLEEVGKSAGVSVTVTGANTESMGGTEAQGLRPVAFAITATGSYASLMRAVELYEIMPAALQIEQLNLDHESGSSRWNLSLRVRLLSANPSL